MVVFGDVERIAATIGRIALFNDRTIGNGKAATIDAITLMWVIIKRTVIASGIEEIAVDG
ncbi:MAG: hypothetical protein KC708_23865 [Anaerolineae bacterium]|nr:hypothetical protein [Anaerolineae bacterium]